MKRFALLVFLLAPASAQFFQQGPKLTATGAIGVAYQGTSVALSADGNTALVGGYNDNDKIGAVWVWTRSGDVWAQGPKLVGSGAEGQYVYQGYSVALSADGNTALVGGPADNLDQGAAWVFTRSGGVWTQQGPKLVGSGAEGFPDQGYSVALSADGNTALIGGDLDHAGMGAVWVWTRTGTVWTQQGPKLVGTGAVGTSVYQGWSVALSGDGNTAVVGAMGDDNYTGAVWVWTRNFGAWSQQGPKLVGSGLFGQDPYEGYSVDVAADGNTLIAGRPADGNNTGAAWIFTRSGAVWTQQGPKLVGTGGIGTSLQGISVALSGDGNTALVGGDLDNNSTGAAWVWTRNFGAWSQLGPKLVGAGAAGVAFQGKSVDLSMDAKTALVGGPQDARFTGAAWVFAASVGCSCDANADGTINLGDIGFIIVHFLDNSAAGCHSGNVNLGDIGRVINSFLGKGCNQ
jgi:hypothetical protein